MDKSVGHVWPALILLIASVVVNSADPDGDVTASLQKAARHPEADWLTGNSSFQDNSTRNCLVRPVDAHLFKRMAGFIERNAKLVEYRFDVAGYETNPLASNNRLSYKSDQWSRIITSHGQTILKLAFNYGILSLMTLTFGVERLDVVLVDVPRGCVGRLTEWEKLVVVLDIVLRDMQHNGTYKVVEGEGSVCHRVITTGRDGRASFGHRCCYRRLDNQGVECYLSDPNDWLNTLDILLVALMCAVFIFGPVMMPEWLYSVSMCSMQYAVILKEDLYKTVIISQYDAEEPTPDDGVDVGHTLDLRNKGDFVRCRRLVSELPRGMIIPVRVDRYDIIVNYGKLLEECKVPVGMAQSIFRSIFLCKLRHLDPFRDCCKADVFGRSSCLRTSCPWLRCCKRLGRVLLVVLAPILFYLRLVLYYAFENDEIADRKAAADKLGVVVAYNYRLLQYLTPTHPVFVAAYIIYTSVGLVIAVFGGARNQTRYQRAIIDSFHDLRDMAWLSTFGVAIKNLLWPFSRYGMFVGCLLAAATWPVFLPLSAFVCFVYFLPVVFITCRILCRLFDGQNNDTAASAVKKTVTSTASQFEVEAVLRRLMTKRGSRIRRCCGNEDVRLFLLNMGASLLILMTMYSGLLMVAEVASYLAEITCFTMMGLIVNASKVLRYGTLIFLVIIYSYDTYNNVNKKYLKLNKALFNEIQKRIKDLEQYTSLPSNLQENRGFKSCENSEQDDYETEDDFDTGKYLGWDINDLILFVDQDDTPRIPRALFEQVCRVPVAGSPGPIYRSLLEATGKFFIIILFLAFVFIVVMSFGDAYKISTTNQTLATLAGGFMPFIFTNLLKPAVPEVETGLVSFKSKLEEIIKHFHQTWPMYDFVFAVGEKEPSSDVEKLIQGQPREDCSNATEALPVNVQSTISPESLDKKLKSGSSAAKRKRVDGRRASCMIKQKTDTKQIVLDNKEKIDDMNLEVAVAGAKVDLRIIASDQDQEWLMSSSSEIFPWYAPGFQTDFIVNMDQHYTDSQRCNS